MMEGKCPGCGEVYMGWALLLPGNQVCDVCSACLEIRDGKDNSSAFNSPMAVEAPNVKVASY